MTLSRLRRICEHRLQSLFQKEQLDDQLDQELAFHFDQLVLENIDAGMSPDAARRTARRTLGNFSIIREECRDKRRVTWIHDFRQDVLYGLGMMRKHAGLTAIAALALAFVIGANAAILSVGKAFVEFDLPFPHAERLVTLGVHAAPNTQGNGLATIPDYFAWKKVTREFESMGASMPLRQDLAAQRPGGFAERLAGLAVTPSVFQTLDVAPLRGRVFKDEDVRIGAPPPAVVVISHRLWQSRFDGDPQVVGRRMRLNDRSLTIIGVMPFSFWYPNRDTDYWVPLGITESQLEGSARLFLVTARMKRGSTTEQAHADIRAVALRLAQEFPERHRGREGRAVPLKQYWVGWLKQPLVMLAAAAALGLLIACANVSILLLRRVPARRPEISMRVMMGAGRGRIIRQFLTESLMLAVLGGGLGFPVAWWAIHNLWGIFPPPGQLPVPGIGETGNLLGLTALLSVVAGLFFGIMPAWAAVSASNEFRKSNTDPSPRSPAVVLVSVQVGLAIALLVPAALLMNSFVRLMVDDRGFDPRGVLTFQYRIPALEYAAPSVNYHGLPAMKATPPTLAMQRVYDKMRTLPGAESVAASSAPPVNGVVLPGAVLLVEGRTPPANAAERIATSATYFLVTENFFPTMRTPILRGRDFNTRDTASAPWVAVINETLARRFWPGEDPIGKHFTVDAVSGERVREVIGVVRDVPLEYVHNRTPRPVAYTLYTQQAEKYEGWNATMFGQMNFFIRSKGDPMGLVPEVRNAITTLDPNRPPADFQTLTAFVGRGMRARGLYLSMLGLFALMATVLAAVSIYGVVTSSLSERGIVPRTHVSSGNALRSVAVGLLFGAVGALALAQLIESQLWGITATDPATFAAVTAFLAVVTFAACFIPARKLHSKAGTQAS
jgi:putative ABC transport system permease protein